jgi:hypothetical protein
MNETIALEIDTVRSIQVQNPFLFRLAGIKRIREFDSPNPARVDKAPAVVVTVEIKPISLGRRVRDINVQKTNPALEAIAAFRNK